MQRKDHLVQRVKIKSTVFIFPRVQTVYIIEECIEECSAITNRGSYFRGITSEARRTEKSELQKRERARRETEILPRTENYEHTEVSEAKPKCI